MISPLSVIPKKGGKLCLIIDMRFLNHIIEAPWFKYEGLQNWQRS